MQARSTYEATRTEGDAVRRGQLVSSAHYLESHNFSQVRNGAASEKAFLPWQRARFAGSCRIVRRVMLSDVVQTSQELEKETWLAW